MSFTHSLSSNWSRTKFLKADPSSPGKLGIVAEIDSGVNKIIWHDAVTGVTIDGYEDSTGALAIKSCPACFDCSEEGSNWYFYCSALGFSSLIRKILFGNSVREEDVAPFEKRLNHSVYGDSFYCKIATYKDSVFPL
ncbi:MAG: hypothetical protein HC908_08975 [Calothrix sp. SM1_7_51]|nr:hypothetical protein [Calothrix sp. SM1_7_51]